MWPANYNCPGQLVVSGESAAVDRLLDAAAEARRPQDGQAPITGAFHSPLVGPRGRPSAAGGRAVAWAEPSPPFMSTVTAELEGAEALPQILLDQLTGAGQVHAGRAGARRPGRRHLRRDRAGQGAVRPRSAAATARSRPSPSATRTALPSSRRRSPLPDFCSLEGRRRARHRRLARDRRRRLPGARRRGREGGRELPLERGRGGGSRRRDRRGRRRRRMLPTPSRRRRSSARPRRGSASSTSSSTTPASPATRSSHV